MRQQQNIAVEGANQAAALAQESRIDAMRAQQKQAEAMRAQGIAQAVSGGYGFPTEPPWGAARR
jgi:hypothetical protein